MTGRGKLESSIALEATKTDIAKRIRRVCEHFSEADFSALVDRMAEIEVRYRLRDEWMFQSNTRHGLSFG